MPFNQAKTSTSPVATTPVTHPAVLRKNLATSSSLLKYVEPIQYLIFLPPSPPSPPSLPPSLPPCLAASMPLIPFLLVLISWCSLRKETSPKKPHQRLTRAASDYLDLGRTDETGKSASQQNLMKNYQIYKSLR